MFNRATKGKIEKGAEAQVEDLAQRAKAVKEEAKNPKSKVEAAKAKKKPADKPKAARMDDSSDEEGGNIGGKPAKMDSSDSDDDDQIPSGKGASSKPSAPEPEPVNLMDDLLGMDVPQPAPAQTNNGGLMGLDFGSGPSAPA
jgi:hypothetical protein